MKKFLISLLRILVFPITGPWNYARPMWESEDCKPSYRRIAQFVFMSLLTFVVIKGQTQSQYGFWTLVVLCITFLLLAAIISAQQIIEAINGLKSLLPFAGGGGSACPPVANEPVIAPGAQKAE